MFFRTARQRTGRILLVWVAAGLLLVLFGALAAYHFYNRDEFVKNVELFDHLQAAALPESGAAPGASSVAKTSSLGEWPQWRGSQRDGTSRETGLLKNWPDAGPRIAWEAQVGPGFSCPSVAGSRVVTMMQDGDNEVVLCWDAESGKELWRFPYLCKYDTDRSYGPWPRSTPSIDGDRVYVVSATGVLRCLPLETGQPVRWEHDLLTEFGGSRPQWGVASSPLVEGDLVYVQPGGPKGSVAAFDKRTGKLAWSAHDEAAGYSSPVLATLAGTPQLLVFTAKSLVSVSPTSGQVYWRYPWETHYGCNIATPIVRGDYVFISSGYGKGCALLKVAGEKEKPQVQEVYHGTRMRNHFSSSVLVGEHIYGFDDPGLLTCLDFRTGKVIWRERGFKKGTVLAADGMLILLSEDGKLALAEATPEGLRQRSACQFSDRRCWTAPVLANGKLYVRDDQRLVCYDVKKQ